MCQKKSEGGRRCMSSMSSQISPEFSAAWKSLKESAHAAVRDPQLMHNAWKSGVDALDTADLPKFVLERARKVLDLEYDASVYATTADRDSVGAVSRSLVPAASEELQASLNAWIEFEGGTRVKKPRTKPFEVVEGWKPHDRDRYGKYIRKTQPVPERVKYAHDQPEAFFPRTLSPLPTAPAKPANPLTQALSGLATLTGKRTLPTAPPVCSVAGTD